MLKNMFALGAVLASGLGEDFGNVSGGAGVPAGGITSYEDFNEFAKAVQTSSYNTDHASLTGMSALRLESLETTMRAVVATQESARLYKDLKRQPVTSTLHEWNVQTDLGGQFDGLFNSELGDIASNVGDYERHTMRIKYMMTQAQISHVASVQSIQGAALKARENKNAITRLVVGSNRALYHGDESVAPNAIQGITAQLRGFNGGSNVIDAQAEGVTDGNELAQLMFRIKADSQQADVFGNVSHLYIDQYVQNDLDLHLFPQYRVHLDAQPTSLMVGAPVSGIRTSSGNIETVQDMWINNPQTAMPNYARKNKLPDGAPGQLTKTAVATPGIAGSTFTALRAGVYYYSVAPIDANGVEGLPTNPVSVTVAAGGGATITRTPNADGKATGWRVYRSTQDPATAPTLRDMRIVTTLPIGTASYVDGNQKIAGASSAYALTRTPDSIQIAQLLPVTQFPLFATSSPVIKWAVLKYWALQLGIPQHHYVIENIQPKTGWQAHKRA